MNDAGTATDQILQSIIRTITGDSPVLSAGINGDAGAGSGPGFSDLFRSTRSRELEGSGDYEYALEYIYEGYLLHYGVSRIFDPDADDFSLLAGDYMYARGLDLVSARNDLVSIRLLAELIDFCALVHCEQLDTALAADAWTITTLTMATAAGGDTDSGDETRLPRQVEDGTALKERLEALIDRQLDASRGNTAADLRDELCNIYNSFNQQRRQDGTG
jgi:hypothetical protein